MGCRVVEALTVFSESRRASGEVTTRPPSSIVVRCIRWPADGVPRGPVGIARACEVGGGQAQGGQ